MGSISIWHWLIALIVILLIFGAKRLHSAGWDLGSAIRSFRSVVQPNDDRSAGTDQARVESSAPKKPHTQQPAG
jgi:sec-independent protein translocase protein TatA